MSKEKIVVITGAGISAESGLQTFRDSDGLWNNYAIEDVATLEAWARNRELVLDFYNARRKQAAEAEPNSAHRALAELEARYEVVVITQNVDDLHERGGASNVIHLHGELAKVRSTLDSADVYDIGSQPTKLGDTCKKGSQLRPHIVWFGEIPQFFPESEAHVEEADKVLVVGTSLTVYPAASLLLYARADAERVVISPELDNPPAGYLWHQGKASEWVPKVVNEWLT